MKIRTCQYCKQPFTSMTTEKYCSEICSFKAKAPANSPKGECVEWVGAKRPDGYGHFTRKGRQYLAHRYSYTFYVGPILPGNVVCHKCDNPTCINPDHLFQGSQADNIKDCVIKGRQGFGETHSRVKLTEKEVLQIRDLLKNKAMKGRAIARAYGVTPSNICHIKKRKLWPHI